MSFITRALRLPEVRTLLLELFNRARFPKTYQNLLVLSLIFLALRAEPRAFKSAHDGNLRSNS